MMTPAGQQQRSAPLRCSAVFAYHLPQAKGLFAVPRVPWSAVILHAVGATETEMLGLLVRRSGQSEAVCRDGERDSIVQASPGPDSPSNLCYHGKRMTWRIRCNRFHGLEPAIRSIDPPFLSCNSNENYNAMDVLYHSSKRNQPNQRVFRKQAQAQDE